MRIYRLAALASLSLGSTLSFSQSITGFSKQSAATQMQTEQQFDASLQASAIDAHIKNMSAMPHHLGSEGGKKVVEYVADAFKSYGFDTRIETYKVLFPTPLVRSLEMNGPVKYKASLQEPALKGDATSGQAGQLPTYNAWSADGDVTSELVFVNYGLPDDYDELAKMGIDVKGKIVIAKYGRSWRGIKPKVAQEHGAIGCLIYSDPKDDGYFQGDVYPKGAFKNEYGVQRGSIMDMVIYPGDPLTPGIGATENAQRIASHNEAPNLLKIPVLPISYKDAQPLLAALEGPVAPESWRGGLPMTYHIGPGKNTVHLKMQFKWDLVPCQDVIATLSGNSRPDEWVIRGNHHDAWVNGAADPISGLAALLEEAKSIGNLVKQGWKPKRTLVYCAWDGEEPGLIGSTEWVENHAAELQQKCVAYINSDGNGRGFIEAGGSHALTTMMDEISKSVVDPQTKVSVYERGKAGRLAGAGSIAAKKTALAKSNLELGALGSGSDYSPFLQHLGIPSLNLGFGGEDNGGEYHSIYDSYDLYRRFKDPSFEYGVALAKLAGHSALRLADADILPFNFQNLQQTVQGYAQDLLGQTEQMREATLVENKLLAQQAYTLAADPTETFIAPKAKEEVPFIDFSPLQNALVMLQKATDSLGKTMQLSPESIKNADALNKTLYTAEQQLLSANGLPRRGWYKHSLYAPGFYTGYGVKTLPGIREAIEQRNWKEAQEQIAIVAAALLRLSDTLLQAAGNTK